MTLSEIGAKQKCPFYGTSPLPIQEVEKRRIFMNFFLKVEAYIFTELVAIKRATFIKHSVIFLQRNIYIYNIITTDIQEAFSKKVSTANRNQII